jgi:hypothetical protein
MGLLELFLHSHLELLERTSHGTSQIRLRNRLPQLFLRLNARAAETVNELVDLTQFGLELVDPLALASSRFIDLSKWFSLSKTGQKREDILEGGGENCYSVG